MINLVVFIWQYQGSKTNKNKPNPDAKNKNHNILGFLALPKKLKLCCQVLILSFLHLD